jgi:hypothetical protein
MIDHAGIAAVQRAQIIDRIGSARAPARPQAPPPPPASRGRPSPCAATQASSNCPGWRVPRSDRC